MLDLWSEILQTMRCNKLRTVLTGLAVAWGIFMLIVLLGVARGITNNFAENIDLDEQSSVMLWQGRTSMPYKGYKEGRQIRFRSTDPKTIETDNPDVVRSAAGSTILDSAYLSTPRDYITEPLYGVYPSYFHSGFKLREGRFINQADIDGQRKVVVINDRIAKLLYGTDRGVVGRRASAAGLSWQVVGVFEADGSDMTPYAPFTTLMSLSGNTGRVRRMQVYGRHINNRDDAAELENAVRHTLAETHQYDPDDLSAIYVWNRFESYLTSLKAINILNIAMWVLGLLSLLSGIVGVSNIMFVSVKERTHEIGIRRAIGAKPRSIMGQVVAESVAITTLFGYIGVVLGIAGISIVDAMTAGSDFMRHPGIDIAIAVEVTVVLILAGALAGLFPAWKATKVRPVEALRDE